MKLQGSCHCGAVRFSVASHTPQPYMRCYCSICHKTQGGGGYAINIMGKADTLKAKGSTRIYRAMRGGGERHFCPKCASALWVWDKRWPEWISPFASAIDTPLPRPRERQHVFLESKPAWVDVCAHEGDKRFRSYPREAIIDWHRKRKLLKP